MNGKTNKDLTNVMTTVIVMVPEPVTTKVGVKVMPDQRNTDVLELKKDTELNMIRPNIPNAKPLPSILNVTIKAKNSNFKPTKNVLNGNQNPSVSQEEKLSS